MQVPNVSRQEFTVIDISEDGFVSPFSQPPLLAPRILYATERRSRSARVLIQCTSTYLALGPGCHLCLAHKHGAHSSDLLWL